MRRRWYVVSKAAMVLYVLGVIGTIVFALQGEWLRAGVCLALTLSLWCAAMFNEIEAEQRWEDHQRDKYEREIADKGRIARRRYRIPRLRNHR